MKRKQVNKDDAMDNPSQSIDIAPIFSKSIDKSKKKDVQNILNILGEFILRKSNTFDLIEIMALHMYDKGDSMKNVEIMAKFIYKTGFELNYPQKTDLESKRLSSKKCNISINKKVNKLITNIVSAKDTYLNQGDDLHYSDYEDDKSGGFHSETYNNGETAFDKKVEEIIGKNRSIFGMALLGANSNVLEGMVRKNNLIDDGSTDKSPVMTKEDSINLGDSNIISNHNKMYSSFAETKNIEIIEKKNNSLL